MSDSDPPGEFPSEPPSVGGGGNKESTKERVRARLESVIPEILRRVVELGVEKARESPDNLRQFVQDLKVPKDVAHYVFQQIDETKNGLFRVVAKEIRDFLEHTNFAGELQKLLTTVQFEVNTTIRFTPNDRRDPPPGGDDPENETSAAKDHDSASPPSPNEPGSENESGSGSTPRTAHLPRPEIKTAVTVRRGASDGRARSAANAKRRFPT